MTNRDLQQYLGQLTEKLPLDLFIERRFTAATESAGIPVDMDVRFRGMLRDREPKLKDVLSHSRVLILAEPGGGKSLVSRCAVHEFISQGKIPIFAELKEYRGELATLLQKAAPDELLVPSASIDGAPLARSYVLDGIDEVPSELLSTLGEDLNGLFQRDPSAGVFLTARQAFYSVNRKSLPAIGSIFHILDFSDKDINEYLRRSHIDVNEFLTSVAAADAIEEIRNPFVLSIMVKKFQDDGALSDKRSDNLSYMIDRLIESRPRVNRYQQRRALQMLGVAFETYCRNELTEDEALRVICQSRRYSVSEARSLLDELCASILRRTANGLAFQMRSYGEYLAAEALQEERIDRVRELAFVDHYTPNESWINAMSYLIELNADIRTYFVHCHPLWAIPASPAAFSDEEKDIIVKSALAVCDRDKQFIVHHPLIKTRRLSLFITHQLRDELVANIANPDAIVRGNALALLGLYKEPQAIPAALAVVKDRTLGIDLRYSGIVALVNGGQSRYVPELLEALDTQDPLYINMLDAVGALIDETQIQIVLPIILRENAMLSAAYYHFRELTTRGALHELLDFFRQNPQNLTTIRAEGYVEPILETIPIFFDAEIAELCAAVLFESGRHSIYPDRNGPLPTLVKLIMEADSKGEVARILLQRLLADPTQITFRFYFDEMLVTLLKPQTARWLVDQRAFKLIQDIAPRCRGEVREILRPFSGGTLEVQEAGWQAYQAETSQREEARIRNIKAIQDRLLSQTSLNGAFHDFSELKEDYWPELPDIYKRWLAAELSRWISSCNLEESIRWDDNSLWSPTALGFVLGLIDHYGLQIQPDIPLVFVITGWDSDFLSKYHGRFPLSGGAIETVERILANPKSPRALDGTLRFLGEADIWSGNIEATLKRIASDTTDQGFCHSAALNILVKHAVNDAFLDQIRKTGANQDVRGRAFDVLIERGHRATIERALSQAGDDELRGGDVGILDRSPLAWIAKVRGAFAWDKLAELRGRALELELPRTTSILSEALVTIDRTHAATLIRNQADIAPPSWRFTQMAQAIEQERTAKIEAAQRTPFDNVLRRLKGSTSINRLRILCEGSTDRPIVESLTSQAGDFTNIAYGSVGGWGGLRAERDPNGWILGCKEAIIIMDGDQGRRLEKRKKPYTKLAREEMKKLNGLPIHLRILERYGIENYFPQHVVEQVVGIDLSSYYPVPDDVSPLEQLSKSRNSLGYKIKKRVAKWFGFPQPSPKESLYSKSRNSQVAQILKLDDVRGTDLFKVIEEISQTAERLNGE